MVAKKNKNIDYYLNLPWSYTIEQAVDENNKKIYIIRVNELPEVTTDAFSIEEAMESVKEALTLALEMSLESGEKIPEPETTTSHHKEDILYRTTAQRHSFLTRRKCH
jgi:predicted RNase H-like HicB family nuclease